MNLFKHYARLLVSREVAFRLTQEEAYKNLTEMIVPMLASGGVMGDLLGSGIILNDNLKVVYGTTDEQIKIKPGMGIILGSNHYDTNIVVLPEEIEITLDDHLSGPYNGIAYVYADYSAIPASSGYETFKPGQLPGASHIYMLEEDNYSISIQESMGAHGLLLAKIYVEYSTDHHRLVYTVDATGTVNMSSVRPFLDTDDVGALTTDGIGAITLGIIDTIMVGRELLEVSGYASSIFTVTARAEDQTDALLHRNGVAVVVSPIVDMRQMNAARFNRGDTQFEELLRSGVINFGEGGGDRWLKTQKIADVPNSPVLNDGSISLVWLNQSSTGIGRSSIVSDLVADANSSMNRVEYLTSDINATRRALIEESDEEAKESLQATLAEYQLELGEESVRKNELVSQISKVRDVITPSKRKYAAMCIVPQPTLIDNEQIVQYEAEITYMPRGSSGAIDTQVIKAQVFSKQLVPSGINEYGDKDYDYDSMPDEEYRRIVISIQPNERISIRVRSITEERMVSVWSDSMIYDFEELGKNEIALAISIDELLNPSKSYIEGAITAEMIAMLKSMNDEFLAGLVEVRGLHATVEQILADYVTLEERVNAMEIQLGNHEGRLEQIAVETGNAST